MEEMYGKQMVQDFEYSMNNVESKDNVERMDALHEIVNKIEQNIEEEEEEEEWKIMDGELRARQVVPDENVYLPIPNWQEKWTHISKEEYWCGGGFLTHPESFPLGYCGKYTMVEHIEIQDMMNALFSPFGHFEYGMMDILEEKDHGDYLLVDSDIWQIAVCLAKCHCCHYRKVNYPPPLEVCDCNCHIVMWRLNQISLKGKYYKRVTS